MSAPVTSQRDFGKSGTDSLAEIMRRHLTLCVLLLGVLLAGAPMAQQSALRWSAIDYPGATSTTALDVGPVGEIVGSYTDATGTHGYLRGGNGTFASIDFPNSVFTRAAGINVHGEIVGTYRLPTDPVAARHGFLVSRGRFTTVDPPGAVFTNPLGINQWGDIVGRFCTTVPCPAEGENVHGFLFSDDEFTTIDVPGGKGTNAWKINTRGDIVGGYTDTGGRKHVFLFTPPLRRFFTIDVPGAAEAALDNGGINPQGDIVAVYCDTAPCRGASQDAHGFLWSRRRFTMIDIPGAIVTNAFAINARGDVVGVYEDAVGLHGFWLSRWLRP
jgi:uncharacterized membrane protein